MKPFPSLTWRFLLLPGVLAILACERSQGRVYDFIDEAPPAPVPLANAEIQSITTDASKTAAVAKPNNDCTRGTGRNAAGTCEPLHVRTLAHGQRIQIPAGRFVKGFIPTRYDAKLSQQTPSIRWSGQPPAYAEVESFFIDLFEVTHGAYQACVEAKKCTPSQCSHDQRDPFANLSAEVANGLPQICVTHEQAQVQARAGKVAVDAQKATHDA